MIVITPLFLSLSLSLLGSYCTGVSLSKDVHVLFNPKPKPKPNRTRGFLVTTSPLFQGYLSYYLQPIDTPTRLTADDRLAPEAPPAERQLLETLGLAGPDLAALGLLLDLGDPEVRDDGADDHADAEDDEDGAVALRLGVAWARRPELVVCGEDLDEDRAQFARRGADPVARGAVARREQLRRDDVRRRVGPEVERHLSDHVQADGERAFALDRDEDGPQGDEQGRESQEPVFLQADSVQPVGAGDPQEAADEAARVQDHQGLDGGFEEHVVRVFVWIRHPGRAGTCDGEAPPCLRQELRA